MVSFIKLLIVVPFCLACTAQRLAHSIPDQEHVAEKQKFATQGDQEDYWARKLFQEHYHYQLYSKFSGAIQTIPSNSGLAIRYDNDTLQLIDVDKRFTHLFTDGVLYPAIGGFSIHKVSTIAELNQSTNSAQRRRFTFLVYNQFAINPTKYIFELTNLKATESTDLPTFLQGAVLTFIKEGWGML